MKTVLIMLLLSILAFGEARSQYVTFYVDMNHYLAVTMNQLARSAAEESLAGQSDEISDNTESENTTASQLLLAKDMVYKSLTQVDGAVKSGLMVSRQLSLVNDILEEVLRIESLVADDPDLLLFAKKASLTVKEQALELYGEVDRFYTKGGVDALMDYNSRDELLRHLTARLQLLRGSLFGLYRSLYWTKLNGSWKTLNPFSKWVNQDRLIINRILANAKTLSP